MNEVLFSEVFLKIINMSISASWLALVVLLMRAVLKKAPKWVSVLLWGFVALRLICPFSIESMLSLIPSAETVSPEIMMDWTPEISTGIGSLDTVVNPIISDVFAPKPYASANPLQILIPVAAIVWLLGVAAMLLYTVASYLLLCRKVATAVLLRKNIYQSENVDSPFVLGIIKPKIYLPFRMDSKDLAYVIAHEESHIRRKDHWWKPFGFMLLALHWFNPLMWLGYVLLCKDIELACDEKVIKTMDNENRADYTQALVACSINRRRIAACPLAFGEVGVKARVKSVMNYKKPAFWIIIASVVTCIAVAVCFLTNPKDIPSGALTNIHSHTYVVEEVTYEGGMYSFSVVAGDNSPIYSITENMILSSQKEVSEEGVWAELGKLEEMKLTKENFDNLFVTSGNWAENANVKKIRSNTENAWQLIYGHNVFYYVLQQKNGDLYLAYGYRAPAPDADPGSFVDHIRWLFKLAIDTTGSSGMVARSGEGTVPMVSFSKGTMIKDYVDSVYWLTINPGDDEFAPFRVWKDGEEIRGTYTAYDAKTFEPLKHFIPSGLDPQTYLFQNADPNRDYIVLAVFSTEPDAQIYAFGAKFQKHINNFDSGLAETIHGNLKTYYKNSDGTWQVEGKQYKYRLVITGRMHNAAVDSTFVYLSNLETITFDQAWKAAGLSSNKDDYFDAEDAVLVEWLSGGNKAMTLTDVVELSKLGMKLTWEDLKAYEGQDIGSGLYVVKYDIDPEFYLLVGDGKTTGKPMYASLNAVSNGASCDIRESDVESFIKENQSDALDYAIHKAVIEHNADGTFPDFPNGFIPTQVHCILGFETKSGTPLVDRLNHMEETTVYVQYVYNRYLYSDGELTKAAGNATTAKITFSVDPEKGYTLKEFWEPNGGSAYAEEIRRNFPKAIADIVMNPQSDIINIEKMEHACLVKAQEYISGNIDRHYEVE